VTRGMTQARRPETIELGSTVVVVRRREMAPGSTLSVEPGDVGTVVRLSDTHCAVEISGMVVVLLLTDVQVLARP
jgi:hypothetical protein